MTSAHWREQFPILARKNYLNSCSLGALSNRAVERVQQFYSEWHELGAAGWYGPWWERLEELRSRVATMLGADRDEIAFTASTSAALTTVASAFPYAKRPRVVVSELDFPTLVYQWLARDDVEVVRVPSDDGITIDPQRFADAVDERTSVLAVSHVYFTTGAIQDLATLADIAHSRDALLLVDAYQSIGQIPLDVKAANIDILTTGPLKWLLGGPGLGYLYVRNEVAAMLRPRAAGWFGTEDQFAFDSTALHFHANARRFELGTPAVSTAHTALGGQEIIDEIGVAAIRARNIDLTERLVAAATNAGLRMRCADTAETRSAIVMIHDDEPQRTVAHLASKGIIVDARPGYVRVSPHFYNTEDEVDQVVHEIVSLKK